MFNTTTVLSRILLFLLVARTIGAVLSDAGIGWDFSNYYRVARELFHGRPDNLFRVDPLYAYFGFPGTIYLFAPIGGLEDRTALYAFKLMCAASFAGALWLLYPVFRYAVRHALSPPQTIQAYLLVALLYSPAWFVFSAGGQMSALCLLLLCAFLRLHMAGRTEWAAAPLALCMLLKPFFAPMGVVFLLARQWRLLLHLGYWLAAQIVLSLLLLGWEVHAQWLSVIRMGARGYVEPWWNNSSLWNVFDTIWLAISTSSIEVSGLVLNPWGKFMVAGRLLTVPLIYLLMERTALRTMPQSSRAVALTNLALLFCAIQSAIVWPHYLSFLFPFLLIVTFTAQPLSRLARAVAWLALISTLAVQSRPLQRLVLDLLPALPALQGLMAGLFGSCTLLLCLVLVLLRPREVVSALACAAPATQEDNDYQKRTGAVAAVSR